MSGDALDANLERLRRAVARRSPAPVVAATFASAPAPTAPPVLEPVIETSAPALAATPPASPVVSPQPARPATPPAITHAASAGADRTLEPRPSGWFARLLQRLRPRRASPDA